MLLEVGIGCGQSLDDAFRSLGSSGNTETRVQQSALARTLDSAAFRCTSMDSASTEAQIDSAIKKTEIAKTVLKIAIVLTSAREDPEADAELLPVWIARIEKGAELNSWMLKFESFGLNFFSPNKTFNVCQNSLGMLVVEPSNAALDACDGFDPAAGIHFTPWIGGHVLKKGWFGNSPARGAIVSLEPTLVHQVPDPFGLNRGPDRAPTAYLCRTGADGTFLFSNLWDIFWRSPAPYGTQYKLIVTLNGVSREAPLIDIPNSNASITVSDFQF